MHVFVERKVGWGVLKQEYIQGEKKKKKERVCLGKPEQHCAHYLELVPKAVARAVNMPQRKEYGFFLVIAK